MGFNSGFKGLTTFESFYYSVQHTELLIASYSNPPKIYIRKAYNETTLVRVCTKADIVSFLCQ